MTKGPSKSVDHLVEDTRVHGSVYTDPEIFDQEMHRIFSRCWVYVGHESEIPEGGDYKSSVIGRSPILIVRSSDDGEVRAFFNRCRHRAAQVCQSPSGNANYFRCAYHGWTYGTTGQLIGVPFRESYEGTEFDKEKLGLSVVPAIESYRGFIFARINESGPSLSEYLGNAAPYLDRIIGDSDENIELRAGVQRYDYAGNWKLQLENVIDNYHVSFVHKTFVDLLARRSGSRGRWHDGVARALGNGHAVIEFPVETGPATGGEAFNLIVFPNLACVGTQVRVIHPKSVDYTVVEMYPTLHPGLDDTVNAERLRIHEESFGPAGFVSPDDVEVSLERVQRGLAAQGDDWLLLSRGVCAEEVDDRGVRTAHITDEVGHRGMYRAWKSLMEAPQ